MDFYVIVFETTHHAIAASRFFKDKDYKFDVIPTPRMVTNNCGFAIKFGEEDLEKMKESIKESNIKIKGIYKIQKVGDERTASQIM
jgi:hypothetical protein